MKLKIIIYIFLLLITNGKVFANNNLFINTDYIDDELLFQYEEQKSFYFENLTNENNKQKYSTNLSVDELPFFKTFAKNENFYFFEIYLEKRYSLNEFIFFPNESGFFKVYRKYNYKYKDCVQGFINNNFIDSEGRPFCLAMKQINNPTSKLKLKLTKEENKKTKLYYIQLTINDNIILKKKYETNPIIFLSKEDERFYRYYIVDYMLKKDFLYSN